jgi:nitroimidazol reductase NimA-like FMN-containing flavoprotein (pyridoxamine 5'-phosphate oxidase superfamily)
MRSLRRKEKAIESKDELVHILENCKYITVALCLDNEPYLVTLSHGYDRERNCLYFHCARDGKKSDILKENNVVWGQALLDNGYAQGSCDHLYATTQFKGRVVFLEDFKAKKVALEVMIKGLEDNPQKVMEAQLNEKSIQRVQIGRIDIEYMSGKKSAEVIISL